MSPRTGGELVVEALRALDVDCLFGVASVHNLPILDAIRRLGGITVINVRHEQAAVHAADGYARVTGRLGVALASTGPGTANAMGGLFEASFAGSRVLLLTGQVESRFYGQGRGYLHEAEQQVAMLRTVTRETWSVRRAVDIGEFVVAAGRATDRGAPGPTAVEIPVDLQYATVEVAAPAVPPVPRAVPDPGPVRRAAELLAGARRPLLWAGGGVLASGAWDELCRLVERWRIPVVTSVQGRGSLPEDHPLCLGALVATPPLREVVEDADVVLAVGTHFQMYQTDMWRLRLTEHLIHADANPSVFGRSYPPAVCLTGDAAHTLDALHAALTRLTAPPGADPTAHADADAVGDIDAGLGVPAGHTDAVGDIDAGLGDPEWLDTARRAADAARSSARQAIGPDHRALLDTIRRLLPRGGAVVRDATVPAYYWGDRLLPILTPRTSVNPTSAAIGPGLPLAIGAAVGCRERTVVLHGDGGIMLSIGELATLAQFRLPVTVCVFNDGGYGVLRGVQRATFGGATNDVDLHTPDFVALGRAMGVPSERIDDPADFERVFARSVEQAGPYLIDIDLTALAPMAVATGPVRLAGGG